MREEFQDNDRESRLDRTLPSDVREGSTAKLFLLLFILAVLLGILGYAAFLQLEKGGDPEDASPRATPESGSFTATPASAPTEAPPDAATGVWTPGSSGGPEGQAPCELAVHRHEKILGDPSNQTLRDELVEAFLMCLDEIGEYYFQGDHVQGMEQERALEAMAVKDSQRLNLAAGLELGEQSAKFAQATSGQMVVVACTVVNNTGGVKDGIMLRCELKDDKGGVLASALGMAGSILSEAEYLSLSQGQIRSRLLDRDGLGQGLAPGAKAKVMFVFADVPEGVRKYTLEVVLAR